MIFFSRSFSKSFDLLKQEGRNDAILPKLGGGGEGCKRGKNHIHKYRQFISELDKSSSQILLLQQGQKYRLRK